LIENIVKNSFLGEINALKPGNVSIYADGHDMTMADFVKSADAATPYICQRGATLGERVFTAVKATIDAVSCNTNLGMILLYVPLVMAAEGERSNISMLQNNTDKVLQSVSMKDAQAVFAAIALANPGGVGKAEQYDVNFPAECSLHQAMQLARHYDNVALQYVTRFDMIFTKGLCWLEGFVKRWNSVEWALVAIYLQFMASYLDSHIYRKYGTETADIIKQQSRVIFDQFIKCDEPILFKKNLLQFDKQLKDKKINPGTSADLAAASLLVYNLTIKK